MSDPFMAPQVKVRQNFLGPLSHGHRVMEPNPGNYPAPDYVFLIYITQNAANKWIARHMYAPKGGNLETTVDNLYDLAKADDQTTPYRVGDALVDLVWKKPCYIYMVLDLDDTEFIDDGAPEHEPIQFHARKPVLGSSPVVYREYDPNYAFYDGYFTNVRTRSAFRCGNYLTDETGNELKYPRKRVYGFEIRYSAPWQGGPNRPHDIDPDGENQGPPRAPVELETRNLLDE